MSRPREPIALLEAKGKKHLTKAERAKRTASEPALAAPASGEGSKIRAPDWLPEWLREDFNALRAKLVAAGIFSGLDRDTLIRSREMLHIHNTCGRWNFGNVRCYCGRSAYCCP